MADRLDYFFRQRVTEAELDLGFELLERAERNLPADLGFVGVVAGAVVSQHAPVPDLTVDVSGPGAVYDQLGERVFFSSLQNVNVAQDDNGVSTSVAGGGNEKIVSVFLKFDRALSDPRVDGNSLTVFFRRDESFTVSWRHPDEEPTGRSTIWLHPSIPLRFVFDEPEPPAISRAWIDELVGSANASGGITLIAEHMDASASGENAPVHIAELRALR